MGPHVGALSEEDSFALHSRDSFSMLDELNLDSSVHSELSLFGEIFITDCSVDDDNDEWDPDASDYSLQSTLVESSHHHHRHHHQQQQRSSSVRRCSIGSDSSLSLFEKVPQTLPPSTDVCEASRSHAKTSNVGKQQQQTNSKRVTFNPRAQQRCIESFRDMDPKEVSAVWYSQNEIRNIHRECANRVKELVGVRKSTPPMPPLSKRDSRGLLNNTPIAYNKRMQSRRALYKLVKEEQELQKSYKMDDPQWLAALAIEHSKKDVRAALSQGLKDAKEVMWEAECYTMYSTRAA